MSDLAETIRAQYGSPGLLARIDAALTAAGVDPQQPRYQDCFPFDQLHSMGIVGTKQHAQRAKLRPGLHVLDLGCGIGGVSRYLAGEWQCKVTGVDLTPEYVEVAQELSRRCGLGNVEFRQADGLALPFAEGSFDHVWCHYVTMNIPDKGALMRQVARVLKRGGRFSCGQVAQGPAGPPDYPVPWARSAEASFLTTREEMRGAVERAGLRIIEEIDTTPEIMEFAKKVAERVAQGHPGVAAHGFVLGEDFPIRARNSSMGFIQGKLLDQFILAQRE